MLKRTFLFAFVCLTFPALIFGSGKGESKEPGQGESVVITIMDAQAYALEEYAHLLDLYKEANPEIDFEVQHVPNDYQAVRSARINSGQIPDIIVGQSGSDVAMLYDYAYDFTGDPVLAKFTGSSLLTATTNEGRVLSLPWVQENMAIIYNKDAFTKAGISNLPQTLDELEEACEALQAAGITPFGVAFGETWVISHIISHFIGAEANNPRDIVSQISEGKLSFNSMKKFDNAFRLIDLMIKYGVDKPLEVGWEKSENMLANGEVAMIHMGDWAESVLKNFNPDVNMAFLPMPVSNNPSDAVIMSYVSWQYVLNKDSKHFDEAKKVLEYILTSPEGADWMGNGIGSAPPIIGADKTSGMLSSNALGYINESKSKSWNHVLWPNGFNEFLGSQFQEYILGGISPEALKENLSDEWLYLAE